MLARTRLARIARLSRLRLMRGARKSLAVPLLFAGVLCASAPFVYGAVDRLETDPVAAPAPVTRTFTVPLLTQSTATGSVGHVRIVNRAMTAGTVSIMAFDDTGLRHGPVTLDIGAGETVHFDAGDLEEGDAETGFRTGTGAGTGAWRLELSSTLDIEVLSYARTQDGLVGGMQDVVRQGGSGYRVALFNPASTLGQVSRLRLINPGAVAAAVTVEGIDDTGASPGGAVRLTLAAGASRLVAADELETGDGDGLSGSLGDGSGRWRLIVTADRPIMVMNLLASSSSGAMSNLSSGPVAAVDGGDGATTVHAVGLFPSASDANVEGVLRIVNRTDQFGRVDIEAIDDTGTTYGPVTLWIGGLEGLVLTSGELEGGSTAKGLSVGTGAGSGDWRLRLSTSLDIAVLSYVRPLGVQDGLLSAMHDLVPRRSWGHQVTLLAAAETPGQSARLRLINPSATEAGIVIRGVDGTGSMPGGEVELTLGAGASRVVTVSDLEGGTGSGLSGSLGDGSGQWHLGVTANRRIQVMSLLSGPGGHLANLSTAPNATLGALADASGGSSDTATAAEVFREHISGVVQSRCIACHVEGGVSGNTRLVFERSSTADHEALNLDAFATFLSEVEGGTSVILNKIQGVSHGGGAPVPAGSAAFAEVERFLGKLDGPSALFAQHISEAVVQSKCIACHVAGGVSGNTRLVFAPSTTAGHEALNLAAFEAFLSEVESGASVILSKIQGVSHGGGAQVPAGTTDFAQMGRFLGKLDEDVVPAAITVETLFEPVRMAPLRKTLRRAALIFAGRIPTDEEYASIYTGPTALRRTIRNMMTGPAFHEFIIRGANDRLLTDRDDTGSAIDSVNFIDFNRENYRLRKEAQASGDFQKHSYWYNRATLGARRAPLELIAHVVENDRPYTEILTADYIMANPFAARAYGASTAFDDPQDPREFRPSKIVSYYRQGDDFIYEYDPILQINRIIDPGSLRTDYPHAGVLNTSSFLFRYPTTATNRNRARARWTYYHFLGVDIENSASRTMDPVALADTNNPTMHNPACTVCHTVMDPVAGAFQDYGDDGLYKDQRGGMDSLHELYKTDPGTALNLEATSWQDREALTWPLMLPAGTSTLKLTHTNHFWDEDPREGGDWFLDRLDMIDEQGHRVATLEFENLELPDNCGGRPYHNPETGREDSLILWSGYDDCALIFQIEVPEPGIYSAEVLAWSHGYNERFGDDGYARLGLIANPYEKGDTWYRDMRTPGFGSELAPKGVDSLQWLAQRIVADPRFAEATVKFWWPAIMGREVAEPPAEESDTDFEARLLAANAQGAEVQRLAAEFRQGFRLGAPYNLKDLLVEMVLSKWFRADALGVAGPVRKVALRDAGARRLLTPEELAHKTAALMGYQWGRFINVNCWDDCDAEPNRLTREFRLPYGGIDSDGITERARNVTSVMAGVAKRHAVKTSCSAAVRELYLLPDEDRRLFRGVDRSTRPDLSFGASFEIEAASHAGRETLSLAGSLAEGSHTVRLSYLNDYYGGSSATDRNVHLDRLDLRNAAGQVVTSYELETLESIDDCNRPLDETFSLHCGGSLDVPINVPAAGRYTIEMVAWANQAGDELPQLDIVVLNATNSGSGAEAIRAKLVELYDTLFGVEVTPYSPDVDSAFELFVDVAERGRDSGVDYFHWWECHLDDTRYFDDVLGDIVVRRVNEWGDVYYEYDQDRVHAYMQGIDFSDAHYSTHAWVVVLSYLLMDYRYLYL